MTLAEISHILALCLVLWLLLSKVVHRDAMVFRFFILVKFLAAISIWFLYLNHYNGGDTIQYFEQSLKLLEFYDSNGFHSWWRPFIGDSSFLPKDHLLFYKQPRAIYFSNLIVPFTALCLKSYWLTALWLTLFTAIPTWWCFRQLSSYFHSSSLILAILFWPSLVFWSSGITKEVVAMPIFFYLITLSIMLIKKSKVKWWHWLYLIVGSWMLWSLKYYYAALLIPFLLSLVIHSYIYSLKRTIKSNPKITWVLMLGIILSIATLVHPNLNIDRMWEVIIRNHFEFKAISSGNAFIELFIQTDGSIHFTTLPWAMISGLYRPFIWESWNTISFVYAVENLVLFLASIITLVSFFRQKERAGFSLSALAAILFIIVSAVLLTISAPNFGTLSRYAIGYKPILVWIIMEFWQNNGAFKYSDNRP